MRGLMKRFEYVPGTHRPKVVRNGALFLALFGAVMGFAFLGGTVPFWPKGGYTVKAEFDTAANVTTKTPVRMRGVKVGKVEKVERNANADGVVVTMRINDDNGTIDLRRDARAHIYWRTLLGFAFYIELDGGSEQAKLGGATIPMSRTTAQVEFDEALAAIDKPSREGIRTVFREFDEGFDPDEGSRAGRTLDALGPAMRQVGPGLDALRGTESGDLTRVVRNSSRLMGALARNEVELGQVIANGNAAIGVTAARRADLGQILAQGPETLRSTRTTMVRLRTTLGELDPIADDLRPGARKLDDAAVALRPALDELTPLLDRANPLLRSLRPAVSRLGTAARAGVPLLEKLDPTVDRLNEKLLPALSKENPETDLKVYEMVGPTIAAVQSSAQQFDSRGHVQRFHALEASDKALGALPCNTDLLQGGTSIDCSDVQAIAGALLGIPPTRVAGSKLSKAPRPSPAAPGSSGPSGDPSGAGPLLRKLADAIGGTL
jgi:virulence factor Mce-like protein